ncbi:MAG: GNAT family N-acetyltransferase [Dehalococcoidales bacterium]|nr:GNAT family N-acetyltransferase [Dehalococcoidales bacterium]
MTEQPTLTTKRLILRPYTLSDAQEIQRLIGDRVVADTLLNVPYPYEDGMAEDWISKSESIFEEGKSVHFAITQREQEYLIGGIGLNNINHIYENAEMGYWIGKPYWGNGYCTEAARAVVKYGFDALGLSRIYAHHFTRNPTSGRVMQKVGMKHEGHLRQAVKRWDKFEDLETYGILKSEFRD